MTTLTDRREAAPTRPLSGLSHLIHPVPAETFQREYWERRPLLIRRQDPGYYADLLSLDDVDRVLNTSSTKLEGLRVVSAGRETSVDQLAANVLNGKTNALEALYECYRSGATIVLNSLQHRWEPLQAIARELGAEISARVQTNIYVTPPGAQGFSPHYDTHDVFVIQVHGTKHWRLARQPYELPLPEQLYDRSQPEPEAEQEFDLDCGDLLYMPRGTVHWATSDAETSAHITIGVHPVIYAEVLTQALNRLFEGDVRFRRVLPLGFVNDERGRQAAVDILTQLIAALATELSPKGMMADSLKRATSISSPTLRYHLTDLDELDRVALDTRIWRRHDQRWTISSTAQQIALDFHNKTVRLPADVADEVQYLAEHGRDGLTAAELPGDLDETGRLVLIKALIREGFLTLGTRS